MDGGGYVTEIPSYLKQLARLVAQGFYQTEDALIIDMLVRNSCMKEKDIEELLKFDLKSLRARLATLKIEKFVQLRLRMETGLDGKAQKVNYYFINYKSLVNVVKYKLDHMRKRMETQERDATNRASFKCTNCIKTFTDLEAGELFDTVTMQFKCTFCKQPVEEDETTGPKKDSRLMLAKFNDQMEILYELLRKAEDIRLAPELLEPEPPRNNNDGGDGSNSQGPRGGMWSGEATRMRGLNDQTRIDFKIGEADNPKRGEEAKERPVWMFESTIGEQRDSSIPITSRGVPDAVPDKDKPSRDDVMSVLLAFEKKSGSLNKPMIPGNESDSDDDDSEPFGKSNGGSNHNQHQTPMDEDDNEVELIEDDDERDQAPLVVVGNEKIPLTEIKPEIINRMTNSEKETYLQQYQDYYADIYD